MGKAVAFVSAIMVLDIILMTSGDTDSNIRCPELPEYYYYHSIRHPSRPIIIEYHPERRVNSRVLFSCPEKGQELIGNSELICLSSGQWSDLPPNCSGVRCKAIKTDDLLQIDYSNDREIGSYAAFHCPVPRKRSGVSLTYCLDNGTWAHPTPTCKSSCKVPFIENGDMGRYEIQHARESSQMEFKKVLPGEDVNSGDTLSLRCRNGSLPVKNSEFVESNVLEVTCNDGTWSTDLQCKQTKCNGTPPVGKNVMAVINRREHGTTIYYRCNGRFTKKIRGNVTCHFGSWIGVPPKCFNYPCYTSNVSYPGLVKPPEKYFDSSESFEVNCETGYRKSPRIQKITCARGKWDISENPCINDGKDRATSIIEPSMTPSSLLITPNTNVESSSHPTSDIRSHEDCFCSYEYEDQLVNAYIGRRILQSRDIIRRGEVVSFECKFHGRVLTWQNGLRLSGKANVTCNTCKAWERKDVPICKNLEINDAVITYNDNFLPGGIINIRKQERQRFSCSNIWRQPDWDYGQRRGVSVSKTQIPGRGSVHYISYLDIDNDADDISGEYECYVYDDLGQRSGSTSLHLQVNGPKCSIHDLSKSIPEGIEPDLSNVTGEYVMFGSKVQLICTDNSVMNGDSQAQCGEHGNWKLGNFQCVLGCILNLDPSSHLLVQPKKDVYMIGDSVLLSCPPGEEMSAKVERVMCLPSRWSDSLPECKEPGEKEER